MPLHLIRNDITRMSCDAIVNPTNAMLLATGGTDLAIHLAAGPEMDVLCSTSSGCAVGAAICTPGFRLPCNFVFHTVSPVWSDGEHNEEEQLASCYRACFALAEQYQCASVAFPVIAGGTNRFPKSLALRVAVREISDYLLAHEMTVYLVVYNREIFRIGKRIFTDIEEYIDDHYTDHRAAMFMDSMSYAGGSTVLSNELPAQARTPRPMMSVQMPMPEPETEALSATDALAERLRNMDESFSQSLLRRIDERGMKDSECYKRANVDRKLFSKIRTDPHYRPSKPTVLAFAIALQLSLEDTADLLRKAGYALSHSSKSDVIIEYFIQSRNYDIYAINEALFYFDQVPLGG